MSKLIHNKWPDCINTEKQRNERAKSLICLIRVAGEGESGPGE